MIKFKPKYIPPTSVVIPDELKERARLVQQLTGATISGVLRVALQRYCDEILAQEESQ